MQKWDYLVVQCDTFYPNPDYSTRQTIYQSPHMVYDKKVLDPTVDWPTFDWDIYDSRRVSNQDPIWWRGNGDWSKGEWSRQGSRGPLGSAEVRVAWSPSRKCWTYLWKCLEEVGEEGWELVGTTPPLSLPYGGNIDNQLIEFCLLFKRPRS